MCLTNCSNGARRSNVPLVDEGVDALGQTSAGDVIELQIKVAGGKDPGWFQVQKVEPRKNWFLIAVEAPEQNLGDVWVFPAAVFDKYARRPPAQRLTP